MDSLNFLETLFMPQPRFYQLIQESRQPAMLIRLSDLSYLGNNALCNALLNCSEEVIEASEFYCDLLSQLRKPLELELEFFNCEVVFGNQIILVSAEIREGYLILYLQEKYSLNLPSHHLVNILDSLGAYVYCKDLNYRYTYVNEMVGKLFGKDSRSLIGTSDSEQFDNSSVKIIRNNIDSLVIKNKQSIEKEEVLFIPNLNEVRTFLSVKKPLIGNNNKVVGLFGISTDITHYKAIEQKLNTILDNVSAYIYIRDTKHRFSYANKMAQNLFQLSMKEIDGKTPIDLLGEVNGKEFQRLDLELFKTKKTVEGIEQFITEGKTYYYWTVKAPLFDDEGNIVSLIGMSTDITEQKTLEVELERTNTQLNTKIEEITKLQATLWEQATQDPLTNLFNRRYFNEISHKEILKSSRNGNPLALLLLDADYFKRINDKFGHEVGDKVLIKLAQIMIEQCRRSDIVCRFGGEEFVILMPAATQITAIERAEKIRLCYQEEITKLLKGHTATLSIGIAMWNKELLDLEGLTKAADQAMYQAKNSGRNQVIVYNAD